jgi:hypothetical protein
MVADTMASYSVRLQREDDVCWVELIVHGEVVAVTKETKVSLTGNDTYLNLFESTLDTIKNK